MQINGFRRNVHRFRFRKLAPNDISRPYPVGGFAWALIDLNVTLLDELGGIGSGAVLHMTGEDDIQPLSRLRCQYRKMNTTGKSCHGSKGC